MKQGFVFLPIFDYIKTRKRLWKKFLFPLIVAIIILVFAFVFDVKEGLDIESVFSDFVNVQISAVAILISFSLAIITILVSADNENIRRLKEEKVSNLNYKPLNREQLSLFQVLLSNISYNVLIEIIYLIILIGYIFLQLILPSGAIKYLTAISIFFIMHILQTLMECVTQMYLTFWKK